MKIRVGSIVLLAAMFALATSTVAFAQCGLPNEIYCQGFDRSGTAYASQNDPGGFGNFATAYDHFTLTKGWNLTSFHFVGEYFTGNPPPFVSDFTLTYYADNGGIPGGAIASGLFTSFNETDIGNFGGFEAYSYDLYYQPFSLGPGTYWASVVPDLTFPPQWGWSSSATGNGAAYQCFLGSCGTIGGGGVNLAFGIDGTSTTTPEPGTIVMLGTGILGLAGTLRRKLL